jgi:glycosyltransferase involved in cell wall biosynthesis
MKKLLKIKSIYCLLEIKTMANPTTTFESKKTSLRQIFFHCGAGKTGSSALQAYFYANKDALKNSGISYVNAEKIIRPDQITSGNGTLLHGVAWDGSVSANDLDAVIESYFSNTQEAICSSENLAWLAIDDWQKIKASCSRLAIVPKFVSFIRDVEPFYISAYHQMVKRSGEWRPFKEFFVDAPTIYNHLQHVRDVANVFGQNNIVVLHYETVKACLDEAFFKAIRRSCEAFDRTLLDQTINRSFTSHELALLKKINFTTGGIFSTEISDILIYARPNLTDALETYPDMLPMMELRHASDAAWVNKTFFKEKNFLKIASRNLEKKAIHALSQEEMSSIEDDVLSWSLQKIVALQAHNTARLTEDTASIVRAVFDQQETFLKENFDSDFYLNEYPDVANAKVDALKHYQEFGMPEGRLPRKNLAQLIPSLMERREFTLREMLKKSLDQSETHLTALLTSEARFTQKLTENENRHQEQLANHHSAQLATEELHTLHLLAATKISQQQNLQLAKQELAFTQELKKNQLLHSQQLDQLSHEHTEQQKKLNQKLEAIQRENADKLSKTHLDHASVISQFVERENNFLENITAIQVLHESQKREQHRQYTEQQNVYEKSLNQAQSELILLQQHLTICEAKFASELSQLNSESNSQAIARETAHSEKIEALQAAFNLQISTHLAAHKANEQAFLAQLTLLRTDAHNLHELANAEVKKAQLENLALSNELNAMRNTRVWRWMTASRFLSKLRIDKNKKYFSSTSRTTQETLIMPSDNKSSATITLAELLSLDNEHFIYSAYLALLGRVSDPEGLRYYHHRLHAGIPKIEILAQLRYSKEGKTRTSNVEGLDREIDTYLRNKNSLSNKFLRITGAMRLIANARKKNVKQQITEAKNLVQLQNTSGNFDAQWYLEQNPEVTTIGMDPFKHYLLHGKKEGRLPAFDKDWYLSQYPDVAKSGVDPRVHYTTHGKLEGRHPAFDRDWYLNRYPDVAANGIDPLKHYIQHGQFEGRFPAYSPFSADGNNYPKWVLDYDTLTEKIRATMRQNSSSFTSKPLLSVIMPVYNPNPLWLVEVIESVRNQIYPNWELCIADDLSSDKSIRPILERYVKEDSRIKVIFRDKNGHISNASNSALELSKGEWIALLDHDDLLPEHALYWVADAINKHPEIQMIYSDEDKINEKGTRFGPYFKCDWNEDLFYSHNMFSHLGVYSAQLIHKVGGFRIGLEGSQDYDLALRCIEHIEPSQIHHIPRVLYHWRLHAESTASSSEAKPYAMIAGERAITEHLARKGINAKAELIVYGYRVRYSLPETLPLVSLIIPTRNGLNLLKQCVESILSKTTYTNYEILIVDNGSDDIAILDYLKKVTLNSKVRVIRDDRPFNYSALNNAAVKLARGEIIGLVNNDIEVISPDWLSEMVSHALRPNIGAVGAKLLYPNDTVQHAGVLLGVTGVAAHAHKNLPRHGHGYFSRANLTQSFSAVTAACLVVRKSTYESVEGLNEVDLKIAFNDIDFCIRLCKAGFKNIWTPYAELYHHESATRGHEDSPEKRERFAKEIAYMERNNLSKPDPAYSLNLTLDNDDFSLAWPPRVEQLN